MGGRPLSSDDDLAATRNATYGLIAQLEGRQKPALDYKQWTGDNGVKLSGPGERLSEEQARARMQGEADAKMAALRQRFPSLHPSALQPLTSFSYNLGTGWMNGSGLAQALDAGDYGAARSKMMEYVKAGGQTLPGLVSRRSTEAGMMPGGDGASGSMPAPTLNPMPPNGYSTGAVASDPGAQSVPSPQTPSANPLAGFANLLTKQPAPAPGGNASLSASQQAFMQALRAQASPTQLFSASQPPAAQSQLGAYS